MSNKHLLIISNNVLSETKSNGKTMLSFIKGIDYLKVSQLYFSGELPTIAGYDYYRISDKDILHGILNRSRRGNAISANRLRNGSDDFAIKNIIGRNNLTLLGRELLWHHKWRSKQLDKWIEKIKPDAIFFVAGDSCFAYSICEYVQNKCSTRLSVYITDDYVLPREEETILHRIHRHFIDSCMRRILSKTSSFFTISNAMRRAYYKKYERDSLLAMNITEDMRRSVSGESNEITIIYTGSLYYGREDIIQLVAKEIRSYNNLKKTKKAKLIIFCNDIPDDEVLKKICINGASEYGGSLNKTELIEKLNESDILLFVESFDYKQIEKVKYSLSTKVPEYMSIGKPILAIGPRDIGSMDYLKDVAYCINDEESIPSAINDILDNFQSLEEYGIKSRRKYETNHNSQINQNFWIKNVLG